jgi:hypothetical protein
MLAWGGRFGLGSTFLRWVGCWFFEIKFVLIDKVEFIEGVFIFVFLIEL